MHPPSSSILRETLRAQEAERDLANQHIHHLHTPEAMSPGEERAAQSRLAIALGRLGERWRHRSFRARRRMEPSGS